MKLEQTRLEGDEKHQLWYLLKWGDLELANIGSDLGIHLASL